jgi:two-component system OmpR family response regulator
MRVLLIEDDPALGAAIRDYLKRESHAVDWVTRIGEARACLPGDYAVVVLDLGLPDGDGLSLLPLAPGPIGTAAVIILTARDRLSDRVRGLDAGADDYLVKPFDLPELAARLRALARRRAGQHSPQVTLGGLMIDQVAREVRRGDDRIDLTALEFTLLMQFVAHPRHVLTREQLENAVYSLDDGTTSNVVEVYVSRLRRKLGRDAIRTVRGIGYQWGEVAEATDPEP